MWSEGRVEASHIAEIFTQICHLCCLMPGRHILDCPLHAQEEQICRCLTRCRMVPRDAWENYVAMPIPPLWFCVVSFNPLQLRSPPSIDRLSHTQYTSLGFLCYLSRSRSLSSCLPLFAPPPLTLLRFGAQVVLLLSHEMVVVPVRQTGEGGEGEEGEWQGRMD